MTNRAKICLRVCFWLTIITFALLQCWGARYQAFVADTISYLDMAEFIKHGEFGKAVSSYWSPGYPICVAAFLLLFNPPATELFAVMKLANLSIFFATACAFEFFLNELLALHKQSLIREHNREQEKEREKNQEQKAPGKIHNPPKNEYFQISEFVFRLTCYAVFAWAFLSLGGVHEDTPDFLLALFCITATGITLKIQRTRSGSPKTFLILGLTLGCAFMTKAFASVLIPIFLGFALFNLRTAKQRVICLLITGGTCAIVSMPYSLMLHSAGRTSTIASAAKLNYLWTVLNGPSIIDDFSPIYGHMTHPILQLNKKPNIFYYGQPIPGTFPLWFDVGYWADGVRVDFSPYDSAVVFIADWLYCWWHFLCYPFWSWFAVIFICAKAPFTRKSLKTAALPITLALWAMFCYSMIDNIITDQPSTQRYFPAYTALLFCGGLASIRIPNSKRSTVAIMAMCVIILICCFFNLKRELRSDVRHIKAANHSDQDIALAINKAGLNPGDEVAMLANGDYDMAWVKMARLRIVSTISEPYLYWTTTLLQRKQINDKLKSLKIKAIVFKTNEPNPRDPLYWTRFVDEKLKATKTAGIFTLAKPKNIKLPNALDPKEGWVRIGNTNCYYLLL